jgi:hypothetical protein
VRQDLTILDSLEPLIKEVEADLVRQSNLAPWAEQAAFLVQLPGIAGAHRHAAAGSHRRHPTPRGCTQAGWLRRAGRQGAQLRRGELGGRITRQGRRDIRSTMVEAAWVAVGGHAYCKELFERLADRVGKPKAIIAIARKLLLAVWHVLTKHVADREAVAEKVAGKFLEWSWKLGRANRAGLDSGTFIRRELHRVQLGQNITTISSRKTNVCYSAGGGRWPSSRVNVQPEDADSERRNPIRGEEYRSRRADVKATSWPRSLPLAPMRVTPSLHTPRSCHQGVVGRAWSRLAQQQDAAAINEGASKTGCAAKLSSLSLTLLHEVSRVQLRLYQTRAVTKHDTGLTASRPSVKGTWVGNCPGLPTE